MDAKVLLVDPKYDFNVGGVRRACALFEANGLLWTGNRVSEAGRLPREERSPVYANNKWARVTDDTALNTLRQQDTPVAVERRKNAEPLNTFIHPERAIYVFGPEDGTLGGRWLSLCHRFVVIPSAIQAPLNLAAAVNVILYDRYVKEAK